VSRDLERAAVKYAVDGYRVFPVKPGSNAPPLVKGFQRAATKDPARVAELWQEHPHANPGIATGQGLVVVDCDTQRAIAQAREQLGVPEATPTLRTPRGGRHFYLAGSAPNRTGFQPGIDLRGTGGYAVGAGARRPDGMYEWVIPPWEVDEATIPAELERLIREVRRNDRPSAATQVVTEGGRNNYLTRVGGSMQRAGFSAEAIRAGLRSENIARCRPPLAEPEVDRIAKSCSTMEGAVPWVRDPWPLIRDERLSTSARFVLDALCRCASDDGRVRGGEWIAAWTGLSPRSITSAVRRLEEAGLVEVKRQRRKANLYRIIASSPASSVRARGERGGR